jgi:hypothetical protein
MVHRTTFVDGPLNLPVFFANDTSGVNSSIPRCICGRQPPRDGARNVFLISAASIDGIDVINTEPMTSVSNAGQLEVVTVGNS